MVESRRKRERIGASSFEAKKGESREGPPNLEQRTPNWTRPVLQDVGPHGQEVERRPQGLQALGRRNRVIDSGPRTDDTADEG